MQTNNNNLVGKTLRSKYYIDKLLSNDLQGGQAQVYYAIDRTASIDKKYIVKQFTPNYNNNSKLEVGKRLFAQEAKILQKLGSHSQIPQIVDYFADKNRFFLVQEWIDGQNLKQELNSKKQLTEAEAIALLKDTLEVLSFVHQRGYIHRDIKPANLIRNKYDHKIYLIDFGAVKEKIRPENIDGQGNFTRTVAIGTVGYMPNEQLRGTPEFCSDIYALGIVAIQGITGRHPEKILFDDRGNPIWREHIPTSTHNYNSNLLNLIDRMVRSYYKERYQTAAEVLSDLHQIDLDTVSFSKPPNSEDSTVIVSEDINETKKQKKPLLPWLIAGLGVFIVATVGILSFGKTERYVAYEESNYGINLDRPEKWSVQEDWMSLQPNVSFLSPLENNTDNFREKITVSIEDLYQPLSLNEYTEQVTAQIETSNTIVEAAQETTFANRKAREIIYQEKDGNKKRRQVWMIKNKQAYIATYTAETDKFNEFAQQADKIIQSVKIK